MSVYTFAPMRAAMPRVSMPAGRPQQKLMASLPSFTGMRLSKLMPLEIEGGILGAIYLMMRNSHVEEKMWCSFRHALHSILITSICLFTIAEVSSLDAPQNGSTVFAMRHGVKKDRLGRPADQRKALVRGLVTEVLRHGKIKTTKVGFFLSGNK